MSAGMPRAAGVWRRLAAMVYELLVVLAIILAASAAFLAGSFAVRGDAADALLTGRMRHLHQAYLFAVLGLYFVWCWHRGGQTLAMRTWKLKLVRADGEAVSIARAVLRYALAWVSLGSGGAGLLWAFLDRDRRFLHDRLSGTTVIATRGPG